MALPRIGLSTWTRTSKHPKDTAPTKATLDQLYLDGVTNAGGLPYLLGSVSEDLVKPTLEGLDGLLLSGGGDVEPQAYGAENTHSRYTDETRDHSEIALAQQAVAMGMPVFGICRGLQILNVAFGGTLHQEVQGDDEPHPWSTDVDAVDMLARRHTVQLEDGSELARMYGATEISVNSLHHQAADQVADIFKVTATANDGTVEGLESADGSGSVVAVQWHPEKILSEGGAVLFADFVSRAS